MWYTKFFAASGVLLLAATTVFAAEATETVKKPIQVLTPRQLLIRRVNGVSLSKEPLMRVLDQYTKLSGLTIKAEWKALEGVGITKETPVTLKTRPMRFSKLLDFTLGAIAPRNRPLAWYLSGKEIVISTQVRVLLRNRVTRLLAVGRPATVPEPARSAAGGPREFLFKETPLNLVVDFFRDIADVNFHVNWRSLEASGITKETPVTLKVRGVSVARAMDLVLDQLNVGRDRYGSVYWVVDDGVVHIATGETLDRTTQVRVYDIGDLLMVVPNFKGPTIDLSNASTGSNNTSSSSGGAGLFGSSNTTDNDSGDEGEEEDMTAQREQIRDTLIEIIKMSIGEDMWAPQGKGSVRILRNRLIVAQTLLGYKLMERAVRR
jgi:hypothetical protein